MDPLYIKLYIKINQILKTRVKEKSAYFTEKYVRYRREEKVVAEQWLIRIHRMIPSEQIMGEKPLEIKINLNFELWFGETNNDQDWGSF